jgi:molybdopterin/thiamine biosynthesis adenylyltransferase
MSHAPANGRVVVDDADEHDRYHRQSLIGWWDQEKLRDATILVVGAGALGNELVKNLALVGVGRIIVVDFDHVENSNLARCVFFRAEDEGRPKAEALCERAGELNPEIELIPLFGDVRLTVGLCVFAEVDVVLGGLDSREARLFVNEACWKTSTPWIDGAIEGLMGVVRVFVPPAGACYECTLSEHDHELIAARRTCAMLTREEMLGGRTPTTATSSSVIAGMQAQEAVKLLHADRLGPPTLAGAGFQFVGLTHDSYVVRYGRRDECLSHDTYDLESAEVVDHDVRFGEILTRATRRLGADALLELEHEIALAGSCTQCGHHEEIRRPVEELSSGAGLCPRCGNHWRLEFAHSIDADSPLLASSSAELGLPAGDIVVGRSGSERSFYLLRGQESGIALVRGMAATR